MRESAERRRRTRPHDISQDEWLWAIPRGLLAAALVLALLVAILLAGTSPAKGAAGPTASLFTLCDMRPHPTLEWALDNPTTEPVAATLYVDGQPVRHMLVAPGTWQAAFKRFEHRHWVMVTADGVVVLVQRVTGCRL